MRPLIVMAALAWSPALAAAPPLCTLPAPGAIPVADSHAEAATSAQPTPPRRLCRTQPASGGPRFDAVRAARGMRRRGGY